MKKLSVGTRVGSYEITGLLGAGGMGEVYRAQDTRLDRPVAIKLLPDEHADEGTRQRRPGLCAATLSAGVCA